MVKFHWWVRLVAIIVSIIISFVIGIEAAAGQTATQIFSGSLSSGPGAGIPSQVTYPVSAYAGETLTFTLDYSGGNSCLDGWLLLSVNGNTLVPFLSGLGGGFSGSMVRTYELPATTTVEVKIEIVCRHATSVWQVMNLAYTLTITFDAPATLPVAVDAEAAAGLRRITLDRSLPIVIYAPTPAAAAQGELFIAIWKVDIYGIGSPALTISADELSALPDHPANNLEIARTADGFIRVYKLTTGEFQVNVGPLPDGKTHVVIFDAIPPTRTYGYTWTPVAP